jgi:hypothetical protein
LGRWRLNGRTTASGEEERRVGNRCHPCYEGGGGEHVNPDEKEAGFGDPREFFDPRRLQLAVRFEF